MSFFEALGLFAAVLLLTYYYLKRKHDRNLPPGPYGLPLLGYLPFVGRNPAKKATELAKKYGPIFSVNIGTQCFVILNDLDIIHKALIKHGNVFSDRPQFGVIRDLKSIGIVFAGYSDGWIPQRKFGKRVFLGTGIGKGGFEEAILEETNWLSRVFSARTGESFNPKSDVLKALVNVMSNIVFGSRYPYDDERFRRIYTMLKQGSLNKWESALVATMGYVPFLKYISPFSRVHKKMMQRADRDNELMSSIVEEHRSTRDKNYPRDFVDEYLGEMEKDETERHCSFHELQLFHYIRDLFYTGALTTVNAILWCILALAKNPAYQKKIWEEIENSIGESGTPSMNQRDQMPFTCAFIQEILRHRTLAPMSIPHCTSEPVVLNGYHLPKGTRVMPNIWAIHYDPNFFDNPEEFRPERFIDDHGCFSRSDRVIAFSVGPRTCLGESLARKELFLVMVSLVQMFKIHEDKDKPLPSFENGVYGMVYSPQHFEVSFELR